MGEDEAVFAQKNADEHRQTQTHKNDVPVPLPRLPVFIEMHLL